MPSDKYDVIVSAHGIMEDSPKGNLRMRYSASLTSESSVITYDDNGKPQVDRFLRLWIGGQFADYPDDISASLRVDKNTVITLTAKHSTSAKHYSFSYSDSEGNNHNKTVEYSKAQKPSENVRMTTAQVLMALLKIHVPELTERAERASSENVQALRDFESATAQLNKVVSKITTREGYKESANMRLLINPNDKKAQDKIKALDKQLAKLATERATAQAKLDSATATLKALASAEDSAEDSAE